MTTKSALRLAPLALLLAAPCALTVEPEITTSCGIDFVTVGDAGNPSTTLQDTVLGEPSLHTSRGGVDYEFRIGRTEITVGEWFEFVEAYLPYYEGPSFGFDSFTSPDIVLDFGTPSIVSPADRPARVGWGYAARYANWLHNGKATEQWAFETGAYETSTWTPAEDGSLPDSAQLTASPDAHFRLPTPDEWIKTVYWDPNRNGPGKGGYWPYPYASAVETVSSEPGEGGDSDVEAGTAPMDGNLYLAVGSYPHASAPWGALDVSGSVSEHLEATLGNADAVGFARSMRYSTAFAADTIEFALSGLPAETALYGIGSTSGFRLVSTVPTPSTVLPFAVFGTAMRRRRREMLAKWFGLSDPQLEECLHRSAEREARLRERGVCCAIAFKRRRGQKELPPTLAKLNRLIASVRAPVEHPFAWLKQTGYRRVRYRGRRRNEVDFALRLIAYNWKRSLSLTAT